MSPLPDFLGLGAERAGTSWIYACLQEHPELCMPEKELHFFSRDPYWNRGLEAYADNFASCRTDRMIGEYSTSYLSSPDAPERIHECLPDVRLIVSLRDPIDRAYSSYRNDRAAGDLPRGTSFGEAVATYDKYRRGGRYATHLNRYREHFDSEDLLVLRYERLAEDPEEFLKTIFRFLKVDDSFVPSMVYERINASRPVRFRGLSKYLNRVAKWLRRGRWTRAFWWSAKRLGLGDLIRSLNARSDSSEGPNREGVRQLRKDLHEEVRELRSLLGWEDAWTENFPRVKTEEKTNA